MTPKTTRSDFPKGDPDLFYELARDRLASQLEAVDALDNKIGLLVSLASGLMGILASVFALRGRPLDAAEIALLAIATLAYLAASALGIRAYFARPWKFGPDLQQVWKALWKRPDDELIGWQVANSLREYYEENLSAQRVKQDALPLILVAVVTQSFFLALALFLVAEGRRRVVVIAPLPVRL